MRMLFRLFWLSRLLLRGFSLITRSSCGWQRKFRCLVFRIDAVKHMPRGAMFKSMLITCWKQCWKLNLKPPRVSSIDVFNAVFYRLSMDFSTLRRVGSCGSVINPMSVEEFSRLAGCLFRYTTTSGIGNGEWGISHG